MKTILMLSTAFLLFIMTGCKKKTDVVPPAPIPTSNEVTCEQNKLYFPLTKGSYWVYEVGDFNTTDDSWNVLSIDSCYILDKDSVVENKTYSVMVNVSTYNPWAINTSKILYRYEDNYVIALTENRYKIFSYCSTGSVLHRDSVPEVWHSEFKILNKDSSLSVPAGTFETRSTENKYTVLLEYQHEPSPYRIQNTYYGKNVGLVYDKAPYMSNTKVSHEKRLLRYHIAEN